MPSYGENTLIFENKKKNFMSFFTSINLLLILKFYSRITCKRAKFFYFSLIILLQSLPGSHSLLIGAKGSGRRSLITLIAHVFNAKVHEVLKS